MHVQWVVFYTIVLLTELLCSGGCIDTGGSTVMHISLVYLLIEFFVVGVVLYRVFGRSGGRRFSGWLHKRSSGWVVGGVVGGSVGGVFWPKNLWCGFRQLSGLGRRGHLYSVGEV